MDVTMPDGTLLQNVPDGMSQRDVMAKYRTSKGDPRPYAPLDPSKSPGVDTTSPDPTSDSSFLQNALEGYGGHTLHMARKLGQFVTSTDENGTDMGHLVDPQTIRDQEELDKPLNRTGGGMIGGLTADIVNTLPVGGVGGVLANGGRAVAGATGAARVLRAALANRYAQAGVDGALQGAATSDEDATGTGAMLGAAGNAAMRLGGSVFQRALGGIVKKSDATANLQHLAEQQGRDMFIPVAQAAKDDGGLLSNTVAATYRGMLPLVPGVDSKIAGQTTRAKDMVRNMAAEESDPTGVLAGNPNIENGMQSKIALKKAFDSEYQNTVKSYAFNKPADFRDQVVAKIKADHPGMDDVSVNTAATIADQQMERFSNGGPTISGENILNAKNFTALQRKNLVGPEQTALDSATGHFDDHIGNELSSGGSPQNLADLKRYQDLSITYPQFSQFRKAVNSAKVDAGDFSPAQLARAGRPDGNNPILYNLGTTANQVLSKPATKGSYAGKAVAYGLGAYGAMSHPLGALGLIGAAHGLSSEVMQKAMMGDTAAQQTLTDAIKNNPELASRISSVVRAGAGTTGGEMAQ